MKRRHCSLTESLEPRLVLSALSPRGSVDPPREAVSDSAQREEEVVMVSRDSEAATPQPQTHPSGQAFTTVADDPVLTPVDSSDGGAGSGSSDVNSDDGQDSDERANVRLLSSDGGSVEGELAGDSLLADDRMSVFVDSDADGIRADAESDADESIEAFDAGIDLSSESSPASSETGTNKQGESTSIGVGLPGILGTREVTSQSVFAAASFGMMPHTEMSVNVEGESWIGSLTESIKSWLGFEELEATTSNLMTRSSVPYMALAGGVSLVAVARKGQFESESLESNESEVSVGKSNRRAGRITERRRFRWFGSTAKERRSRPSGEICGVKSTSDPNLAEPDVSEAFAMSLLQPVSHGAFSLMPMEGDDDSREVTDDSSLSIELVAAGAVTVAGATVMRKSRSTMKRSRSRPTLDYLGTTLRR